MSIDPRLIQPDDDGPTIQSKTLSYLRSHRKAYIGGNKRFGLIWNILSLLVIVLSALTSILAALKGDKEGIPVWVIVVLPAISALLSTLLLQFRVRDMWQLRDEGRMATEILICKAHLIPTETRDVALKSAMELRIAAIELERDQSRRFFSVIDQPSSKDAS